MVMTGKLRWISIRVTVPTARPNASLSTASRSMLVQGGLRLSKALGQTLVRLCLFCVRSVQI
jgi:hypothetical protein